MVKVLMVGNSKDVKGGITSVINEMKKYDWDKNDIKFKFIPTFNAGNNISKILYFVIAYIKIFFNFVFNKPNILHIHMSHKGSFKRAYYITKLANIFKIKIIIHLHRFRI